MEGYVLSANNGVLDLAHRLGFTVRMDPHDATLMIVCCSGLRVTVGR